MEFKFVRRSASGLGNLGYGLFKHFFTHSKVTMIGKTLGRLVEECMNTSFVRLLGTRRKNNKISC